MFPNPSRIFESDIDFDALSAELWTYQVRQNPVIAEFCSHLGTSEQTYIPISFFRQFEIKSEGPWKAEMIFGSSGTTGQQQSRHHVRFAELYKTSLLKGFYHFYPKEDHTIFALLPSYLDRGDSSLVYMVRCWIEEFGLVGSGFYLNDFAALEKGLVEAMNAGERIFLIGVSFALLDFAEEYKLKLPPNAIVMETGGMKGRRKEMVRSELHAELKRNLGLEEIHSEYGMTELLSQAYALGGNRFRCPPWMRAVVTDLYIPGRKAENGRAGRLNIIDLANVDSCAFIRTDDLGRLHPDGSFEVLGRLDHAELRGCNLMYEM